MVSPFRGSKEAHRKRAALKPRQLFNYWHKSASKNNTRVLDLFLHPSHGLGPPGTPVCSLLNPLALSRPRSRNIGETAQGWRTKASKGAVSSENKTKKRTTAASDGQRLSQNPAADNYPTAHKINNFNDRFAKYAAATCPTYSPCLAPVRLSAYYMIVNGDMDKNN